jgi:septum site-determining protein MinC
VEQTGDNDDERDGDGEPELFGTETMAELYARQGRLGEAIRIYAKLLEKNPPADKVERWTERSRSLERARAYAPDLTPGPLPAPKPAAKPAPPPSAPPPQPRQEEDITQVTAVPPAHTPAAVAPPPPPSPAEAIEPTHQLPLVITQPVRSGQVVYARHNDLIVLASVNPGGQVVADGNIHIYGALRGRAMAGAQGASDARIFCQKLEAELLAISGVYLIWDDIPTANLGKPAQVALRGESCVIAPL